MKKKIMLVLLAGLLTLGAAAPARAHFGMVIPSDSMVMPDDNRTLDVTLSFSHPFEMIGMDLIKPKAFTVMENTKSRDLLGSLVETQVMGKQAWNLKYTISRPGLYVFSMEPQPYWEPAEDCFIIHYTKTVVAAFGIDDGWDEEIGLKTEIVPLSKPYGVYAGNVFQGIVRLDGKSVPYAEVEVEYYNKDKKVTAPSDYMITQTLKADGNGVFTYAAPRAGWWGFSAINKADFQLEKDGEKKDVEIGAVIWVEFQEWNEK